MLLTPVEHEFALSWSDERPLSEQEVRVLLQRFGDLLPQPLSSYVDITEYAAKLFKHAEMAVLRVAGYPVGFLAMYANDLTTKMAHIPMLAVDTAWQGRGLGKIMMSRALARARCKDMATIDLQVEAANSAAIRLYEGFSFSVVGSSGSKLRMQTSLQVPGLETAETPVESLQRVANSFGLGIDLRAKRDDLYPASGGGIKARTAAYIFRGLLSRDVDVIVTNGGPQSNHARACALLASRLGLHCHLVVVLDPAKEYLDTGNILLMRMAGATIEFCRKEALAERMDSAVAAYRAKGHSPAYVWGGGHELAGTVAFYDAALECQRQCDAWVPDYVVLASGTGSTQAGLIAGYASTDTRVIGISVARERERGSRIVRDCVEEFFNSHPEARLPYEVEFIDSWTAGGYEETSDDLLELIAKAAKSGLILDPTYSGKGFQGLVHLVRQGRIERDSRVLFWHSGGLMNLQASAFGGGRFRL